MSLRELAFELYNVEDAYHQTVRCQPGMGAEVAKAQKRMRVLDKICDHRDSAVEIPNHVDSETLLKRLVDEIAIDDPPGGETAAISRLVETFIQAMKQ